MEPARSLMSSPSAARIQLTSIQILLVRRTWGENLLALRLQVCRIGAQRLPVAML